MSSSELYLALKTAARRRFVPLFCLLVAAAAPGPALCAQPAPQQGHPDQAYPDQAAASRQVLKNAIQQVLRENPDLLLDILKEHSEEVLEIAQQGSILRKRKTMLAQWEQDARQPKTVNLQGRAFRGNPKAPVTIVAYSDFTCPYCLQAEQTILQLLKKYDGKIRVTFKPRPKDDAISLSLARYSTAAFLLDPVRGWDFFDALFNGVNQYEREGENFLKDSATRLGLDFKKLKAEASGPKVQELLNIDNKEADSLGISGTPYFLVNDLMVRGAASKDMFEEAIEMALRLKEK